MSISPYVMDTLYRQNSIDYIPYDAMAPIFPMGQKPYGQSQNVGQLRMEELQKMSQGPITLYPKTHPSLGNQVKTTSYGDSFYYSSLLGDETGLVVDEIRSIKGQPITKNYNQGSIRASVLSEEDKKGINNPLSGNKFWLKSLISIGAIGLTVFALFKGGKAVASSSGSFWSKLNPKNWFK